MGSAISDPRRSSNGVWWGTKAVPGMYEAVSSLFLPSASDGGSETSVRGPRARVGVCVEVMANSKGMLARMEKNGLGGLCECNCE